MKTADLFQLARFDSRDMAGNGAVQAVEAFRRDGVIVIDNAFSADELTPLRRELKHLADIVPCADKQSPRRGLPPVWLAVHGHGGKLANVARAFKKPFITDFCGAFYGGSWDLVDILNIESPQAPDPIIGWHADCSAPSVYRPDPWGRRIKFHCYLNDVSRRNGAFAYAPGTHRMMGEIKTTIASGAVPEAVLWTAEDIFGCIDAGRENLPDTVLETAADVRAVIESGGPDYDIEGGPGTVIVFDELGVHTANAVAEGHRSVLRFAMIDRARYRRAAAPLTRIKRAVVRTAMPGSPAAGLV
ncbi:MAG: phytanoyl-CoA dioxygenase family protein [Rhodospirillales bacterium]